MPKAKGTGILRFQPYRELETDPTVAYVTLRENWELDAHTASGQRTRIDSCYRRGATLTNWHLLGTSYLMREMNSGITEEEYWSFQGGGDNTTSQPAIFGQDLGLSRREGNTI